MFEGLSHDEKLAEYNRLTQEYWDLTDALGAVQLGRAAVMNALQAEITE